ncbi:MAG TPA: glycosyltransferase family 39 protein [bacterium]|nr:glycosyltransferase family 39 protein [bacterium]
MPPSSREESSIYSSVIGILLAVVILLNIGVHLIHAVYDGRIIFDHDFFFIGSFHDMFNPPQRGIGPMTNWLFQTYPKSTNYPLVIFLLGLTASIAPLKLFMYRIFNLIFIALLMGAAYRAGSLLSDRRGGLLCAALISALAAIDETSRTFNVHFHAAVLMLFVHASIIQLINQPKRFTPYLLTGVFCGLAVLTHPISFLQSMPVFGFLFLWMFTQKRSFGVILRLAAALGAFALISYTFLTNLFGYGDEKGGYLFHPTENPALIIHLSKQWLNYFTMNLYGMWLWPLFAGLLVIFIYHVVKTMDHRYDDLFLVVSLLCNALLSYVIFICGGNIVDVLLLPCLAAVLFPAIAWREFNRTHAGRLALPLLIMAVFLAVIAQKSAAISVCPHDAICSRRHLVIQADWQLELMRKMNQASLPPNLDLEIKRNFVNVTPPPDEEKINRDYLLFIKTGMQLAGREIVAQPSSATTRVNLELNLKQTPWTAREAAAQLRAGLGTDPAKYDEAYWYVGNGEVVHPNTEYPYLLMLMRRAGDVIASYP